jgi:hypothetical protein
MQSRAQRGFAHPQPIRIWLHGFAFAKPFCENIEILVVKT